MAHLSILVNILINMLVIVYYKYINLTIKCTKIKYVEIFVAFQFI